jgi:predicted nucleic acid-binding protein
MGRSEKCSLFSELVEIVMPDRAFAVAYGEAEASLRRQGTPIPTMDLLIGVMAKGYGLPL